MGYLGYKPADKPLTAADITDSIITSAKIVDGTIVNADINASAAIVATKLTGISSQPFRNIVINGDMQIAQRSTSVASISSGTTYHTLDRFRVDISSLGTFTMSQSTDVPSGYGFANSLKLDCTTADASPSAGDNLLIRQIFEGQNLQYLKKGTANAVSLTLSFWVKSTKTGTFIAELQDIDNSRTISKSYTISVSNTWEFKTVTFAGDTTGAFTNDNGESLRLNFWLGAGTDFTSGTLQTNWGSSANVTDRAVGQVNIADSTSNDFLITGVQLEAGTTATDFEFLPYDVDLGRCQRYYYLHTGLISQTYKFIGSVSYYQTTYIQAIVDFKTSMRANPTLVVGSGTDYFRIDRNAAQDYVDNLALDGGVTQNGVVLYNNTQASGTAGNAGSIYTNNASAYVAFESEL
jgi:hypothetical protein